MSSPGPKPVNFDFHKSAVEQVSACFFLKKKAFDTCGNLKAHGIQGIIKRYSVLIRIQRFCILCHCA
jgi:hypothetical protein